MKMNKIIAGTSAAALSLTMMGTAMAANDDDTINLQVEVQETLTFDCYDTVGGTGDYNVDLGTVTAGSAVVGSSRCDVTTNDDSGYYITAENSTNGGVAQGGQTAVLRHEDPNNAGTWYAITDKAETPATAAAYAGTGLGFAVIVEPAGESNTYNDYWLDGGTCVAGALGTANFAGFDASATGISAVTTYQAAQTTTDICYKVDVPATQQSGIYTGSVTYTATTDASAI